MVENGNFSKAYPMKGGDGFHSYSNNSSYQREVIDAVKELINEAIVEKLDINIHSLPNKTFKITDMGCSVGPNTFIAIQNIIEAVEKKYQTQFEYQVFFNDHVSNDFNTLFSSIPPNNNYYPMGLPVPKEVLDKSSPAWNKGKICYTSAGDETLKAYTEQFGKDMDCFLDSRAKEVVPGGLLLLSFPGRLSETPHSQVYSNIAYDLLGSSLMEMAHKGIISEEKVDDFNIPVYFTSPQEVEEAVKRNGCFNIERVVCIPLKKSQSSNSTKAKAVSSHIRAGMESLLKEHFGDEFNLDQLFENFLQKLHENILPLQHGEASTVFLILKRKEVGR
ncbi:loganic acid O-methyltransferase isoform X2 [Manihot esculenta]|uniref:Uncharacterized protein n=1 Tax=Manihot esculenta TaxID=3983 RepID=A0ACB7HFW0_MANES|nr:loganic acid O-methyltransferase isoform X2 [Manihot esculenta]KAG8651647.1 hypothetical protein MANES_06G009000v8 [Manihot esculenta]